MKRLGVLAVMLGCGCFDLNPGNYRFVIDSGVATEAASCARACSTPPARHCVAGVTLEAFPSRGVCASATGCSYSPVLIACATACDAGQCVNEPCAGVFCDQPPVTVCHDATHATVFESNGSCTEGSCAYASLVVDCPGGCVDGRCAGNACAGVACQSPPAAVCLDAHTLRAFGAAGRCVEGACTYTSADSSCAQGCADGACVNDACTGRACNQPPANVCLDDHTVRLFAALGSCSGGACSYTHSDSSCACQSGRCFTPSTVCTASACSNGCCDGDVCVTAQDAARCGSSGAECGACGSGFSCQSGQCRDIDECGIAHGGCAASATCTNTPGGRTCACPPGWSGDGLTCTPPFDAGPVQCSASNCNGCCDFNGQCQASTAQTCGVKGQSCITCPGTTGCTQYGGCTELICNPTTCPTGCCDRDGYCQPGTFTSGCGGGGQACSYCAATCTNRVCAPYQPPFNDGGIAFDRCENAKVIAAGDYALETTSGSQNDYVSMTNDTCHFGDGADRVYQVTIPALKRIEVGVDQGTISGATASLIIGGVSACLQPATCAATSVPVGSGAYKVFSWYNASSQAQNGYVVVDTVQASGAGAYVLSVSYSDVPAADRCERAVQLQDGLVIHGDTASLANDYDTTQGSCSDVNAGNDAVYTINVPGRAGVQFKVTPVTPTLNTSISFSTSQRDCARRFCTSNSNTSPAGGVDTLGWLNPESTPKQVYVVVDSQFGVSGLFDIVAVLRPGICDSVTCATGCCVNNQCATFESDDLCGTGGATCAACPGATRCSASGQCQ